MDTDHSKKTAYSTETGYSTEKYPTVRKNTLFYRIPRLGTLRSTTRQGRRRSLQNIKKQYKFKHLKRSHVKLTTVFDILSLFYDLQDAIVLLKRLE